MHVIPVACVNTLLWNQNRYGVISKAVVSVADAAEG